jgi:peptidyl-prolyl cis-trans isomerase-like 2
MGKNKHSQDKLWITYKELVQDWGGKSEESGYKSQPIRKLPFYCCSLSFMPFKDPVCLSDGTIFDIVNILPYIKKFKKNPVTGKPLKTSDLIKLNFYKNQDDEYHCPITYKSFTDNSTIIAIKETGNVYSNEAYEELNKKPKNFKDLLNNQPFDPKNVIVIQDPHRADERNINDFEFIKNKEDIDFIKHEDENFYKNPQNFVNLPASYMKMINNYDEDQTEEQSRRKQVLDMINSRSNIEEYDERSKLIKKEYDEFMDKMKKLEKELIDVDSESIKNFSCNLNKIFRISTNSFVHFMKNKKIDINNSEVGNKNNNISNITTHERFSEGRTSSSFTSTSLNPTYSNKMRSLSDDEIRTKYIYNTIKSKMNKGYVRLNTNLGYLNLQIHCDLVPRTSENFLELCETGYYNNTIFHRLVKNFVIQGGDPTGTGRGGSSIFGKPFFDEFHPKLTHKDRGILSMANSGKNSNGSQFFITFKATPHLDNKHTVFGEVVGNLKLIDEFEKIGGDEKDKPKKEIKILSVEVFSNPFRDVVTEILKKDFMEKYLSEAEKKELEKEKRIEEMVKNSSKRVEGTVKDSNGDKIEVGKYLNKKRESDGYIHQSQADPYLFEKPREKNKTYDFNFSNW